MIHAFLIGKGIFFNYGDFVKILGNLNISLLYTVFACRIKILLIAELGGKANE